MTVAHIDTPANGATVDITAGRVSGRYLAQVRGTGESSWLGVLYVTAATTPTDTGDYLQAAPGTAFQFWAGTGLQPTWVRSWPGTGLSITVSVLRLADS